MNPQVRQSSKWTSIPVLAAAFLSFLFPIAGNGQPRASRIVEPYATSQVARSEHAVASEQTGTPRIVSYQGTLRGMNGTIVNNGQYSITARLYSDAAGSTLVWEGTYRVEVMGGVFNIALGSGNYPLPASTTLDVPLWIGIQIGESTEAQPLTPLSASPYSLNVADSSITSRKISTDYVKSISVNGQTLSGQGREVNIVTGDGISASLDPATSSIMIKANASNASGQKGGAPQADATVTNLTVTANANLNTASGQTYIGKAGTLKGTLNFYSGPGSNYMDILRAPDSMTENRYHTLPVRPGELVINAGNTWLGDQILPHDSTQANNLIDVLNHSTRRVNRPILDYTALDAMNVTVQGNRFNGPGQLVKLDDSSILRLHGSVVPDSTNAFDLGWDSARWKTGFFRDVDVTGVYKIHGVPVLSDPGSLYVGQNAGGVGSPSAVDVGNYNVFVGDNTGFANTSGYANTFTGEDAGQSNTTGFYNTFSGFYSGQANTTGFYNAFLGYGAGAQNNVGQQNTFLGAGTGQSNTTGNANTFSGFHAGYFNVNGTGNAFYGEGAGFGNTNGFDNTFLGHNAGLSNTVDNYNTFIGSSSSGVVNITNATALGANSQVTQSNSLVLGSINTVNGASADTKVGIGTTAPTQKLEVKDGNLLLSNNPANGIASQLQFLAPINPVTTTFEAVNSQTSNIRYYLPPQQASTMSVLVNPGSGYLAWYDINNLVNGLPCPGNTLGQMLEWNGSQWCISPTLTDVNGSLIDNGGSGTTSIPSGPGARMMWLPHSSLFAFRVGRVANTNWDLANIGQYSVAMGDGGLASGLASVVLGGGTASGAYSVVLGSGSVATNNASVGMGAFTQSTGYASTSSGLSTFANGDFSFATNRLTHATGTSSSAMGDSTHATATDATAMGQSTWANGFASTVMGSRNVVSGTLSTIAGGSNLTVGDYSFGFSGNATGAAKNITSFPQTAYLGDVDLWLGNLDNTARQLRFYEPSGAGAFYSSFRAGNQAATINYTLPISQPLGTTVLTDNGTGTLSWQDPCALLANCPGLGGNDWHLTGNAGTTAGTNYIGTNDNTAFEVHVNEPGNVFGGNKRVMRYEPNASSPNLIGGHNTNAVTVSVVGATIAGGGISGAANSVTDNYGTVSGGVSNRAGDNGTNNSEGATVSGGEYNTASGWYSVVGGGHSNSHAAISTASTIGGGDGNTTSDRYATIGGGNSNTAADFATVAGGDANRAASHASILGGSNNTASGTYSVAAGAANTASGNRAVAIGGEGNVVSGAYSTIGGGLQNTVIGTSSAIPGGRKLRLGDNSFGFNGSTLATTSDLSSFGQEAYFGDVDLWLGNVDGNARQLRFYAPNTSLTYSAATTRYTSFVASGAQVNSNIQYTLPPAQGAANTVLTNNGGGLLSWTDPCTFITNCLSGIGLAPGSGCGTNMFTNLNGITTTGTAPGCWNTGHGNNSLSMGVNLTGRDNTAIGANAAMNNTDGNWNTAIGTNAMPLNQSGSNNTSVGWATLYNNTSDANTGIGGHSLENNTSGNHNSAVGIGALLGNTTGSSNSALGSGANVGSGTLNNATALGSNARVDASNSLVLGSISGTNGALSNVNVGIGTTTPLVALDVQGGNSNVPNSGNIRFSGSLMPAGNSGSVGQVLTSTGGPNSAPIWQDLCAMITADCFSGIMLTPTVPVNGCTSNLTTVLNGISTYGNWTGCFNTAHGNNALSMGLAMTGSWNTATGDIALRSNTSGHDNTATGDETLSNNTTGYNNTATGGGALLANIGGYDNTANGNNALRFNVSGIQNVAIGNFSLQANTVGNGNTAVGYQSLFNFNENTPPTSTNANTALGYQALYNLVASDDNTAIGAYALYNNTAAMNTAVGREALSNNVYGQQNTAVGYGALQSPNGGNLNAAFGFNALSRGSSLNSNCMYNTAIGAQAMNNNNGVIGNNNTAIGGQSLLTNQSGESNTALGVRADVGVDGLTNATALGANAVVCASNTVVLGSINGLNGANSSVNVGIGTCSPQQALDVQAGNSGPGNIQFSGALMPNAIPGTMNQILTSTGANSAPIWQNASALANPASVAPIGPVSANAPAMAAVNGAVGTNAAGNVTFSGSMGSIAGTITVTFGAGSTYTSAPTVVVTPANAAAAIPGAITSYYVTSTATTFTLNVIFGSPGVTGAKFNYVVMQ